MMRHSSHLPIFLSIYLLGGCSVITPKPPSSQTTTQATIPTPRENQGDQKAANEIVLQAIGLLDTGYKFGGSNPEAGLDCSGMVSLVVERATGRKLPHNAAQIATLTRPITKGELRPADLVFFNTNGGQYSHMGIYLGDGKFIHAPSSRGKVRIDLLNTAYYTKHFSGARSLLD